MNNNNSKFKKKNQRSRSCIIEGLETIKSNFGQRGVSFEEKRKIGDHLSDYLRAGELAINRQIVV